MEGVFRLHEAAPGTSPWRRARLGAFTAFVALMAVLVAALAFVVVHFQDQSRRQAQQRFDGEVSLTSQFTGALLTTSVAASEAAAAKQYGGATIPVAELDAVVHSGAALYLVILDASGRRLAASTGAPASAASASSAHVRRALAGTAWFSDLVVAPKPADDALEWAIPFTTPEGRRIEVEGVKASAFATFLDDVLRRTQSAGNGAAYIVDSRGRAIGASTSGVAVGVRPAGLPSGLTSGSEGSRGSRYFADSPIEGSTWSTVMSVRTAKLYGLFSGSKAWLLDMVIGAFALACLGTAFFFRRALVSGAALQASNRELSEVNATLEDRVAERTAAAEDRATELARSNEELEQFSSVASHDLQEPLRKIRMFGDRLRSRVGDDLSGGAKEDLDRMQSAAERMQRLINDLLEFSRVTHRGDRFETVDLSVVAAEVVADLEARILELDARVDVGELPVVQADRTQMRQLFQNLIGNGLKFHRDGVAPVVTVTAKMIPALRPRFSAEAVASDRFVLTVEDNGIGFDQQYGERIFGAFERLHARSAYDGTGIGLSIARKIVWRHGGHITATGAPGQGATFTVTLPLDPQPARKEEAG
jgi:signal transduction histidine kinase